MSGVLLQDVEKDRKVIGYWSKSFHKAQINWSALVKEARAVLEAMLHYKVFILGAKTILYCDHKPLKSFLERETKNSMVNRWSMELQEFDVEVRWVDTDNNISDCLSRLVEHDLYRKHDEIGSDFPEGGQGKEKQDNQESAEEALPAAPMKLQTTLVLNVHKGITSCEAELWDTEKFKPIQAKDRYVQRITKELGKGRQDMPFAIHDGILYKKGILKTPEMVHKKQSDRLDRLKRRTDAGLGLDAVELNGPDLLALVIPKCLVPTVLVNTHVELCHPGRKRMFQALENRVYWKGMRKDITTYTKECNACQLKNCKASTFSNQGSSIPSRPMKTVAVDLWSCSYGTALTAMDLFSMYPFLVFLEDKTSETAARALTEILSGIRTPKKILSDNGKEFVGKEFQGLLKNRGIKWVEIPPYSPRHNGTLERFHRYLNQCLRTSLGMSNTKNEDWQWKGACLAALEAYRKTPHTSTGESPLFLAFAQEPRYTIDHLLPTKPREIWNDSTGRLNLDQLAYAQTLARKNAVLARLRHQDIKPEKDPVFQAGDRVYKQNMTATKLQPRWLDGYRIVKMETERTAILAKEGSEILEKVNVRHLKKKTPVAELLANSKGCPKLYFRLDDLPDLNWPAIDVPFPTEKEKQAAKEAVHRTPDIPTVTRNSNRDVTPRKRRKPARYGDYI